MQYPQAAEPTSALRAEEPEMTFVESLKSPSVPLRPLRPWPKLTQPELAPPPKPLVMGRSSPRRPEPLTLTRVVQTTGNSDALPRFPIEPANDPVQRLADDDRSGLVLLTLVLCVTVAIALLGFGLQVMQ
jgi:hypothetical protein